MAGDYLARVDEIVINAETNDFRFERFCVAVVSHAEGGVAVVGTSTSWDLGRDGVGVGRGANIYVCTSLRDDVDAKAFNDLERITETTPNIKQLYFCSSQDLSEHRIEQIRNELLTHIDHKFSIVALGARQLAELGRQDGKALQNHYGAEIKNILARLETPPDDQVELRGLRLALLSSGSDESVSIRNALYTNAILDTLDGDAGRTAVSISNEISKSLKLGRALDASIVLPHLRKLTADGLLSKNGDVFALTQAGLERVQERKVVGASALVKGKAAIRAAIEAEIGAKILDDEFSRIWKVFEDKMSEYFQFRGEQIVSEVMSFVDADSEEWSKTPTKSSFSFLDDFASAVAATSSHQQRKQELQLAVKDLFSDRTGDAAQWLVSICASFVAACTMGLEYKSSEAITSLLRRTGMVLDTDVVLSLLGVAEPEHEGVSVFVERWIKMKGSVLVATPVLQETAYHASIAERDFDQVRNLGLSRQEVQLHLIENAFVRSFAKLLSEHQIKINHWGEYIRQFRGRSEYDYDNLSIYLNAEYSINRLPDRNANNFEFVKTVRDYILRRMHEDGSIVDKKARDKAMRDAELYVSLVSHVKRLRASDPGATCILVSSARRLSDVDSHFKESGEARFVISIAAAIYLISMLPNVSLGLGSMRAFLFDESRNRFSSDLERTVLRMLHASRERSVALAKRGILMREVRGRLLKGASFQDQGKAQPSVEEVERKALKPENRDEFVRVLSDSLDAVGAETRVEKENRDLREQVKQLQERLERQGRKQRK